MKVQYIVALTVILKKTEEINNTNEPKTFDL